jgi:HAE1 family hydrophobic/amphiphilic exporter-1
MWLTRLAVRRPVTMGMVILSILVLGAISVRNLPRNFLPNAEFPFIGVFIPYPNGIPTQVERDIARPVEEILATLGGVKEIFSHSDADQCFVGVEFDWGRDVNLLRLEVKEKLDQIRPELPADVRDVLLFTFNTNDIPIVEGRISADGRDLSEGYDLIENRIVNRLQRIPGVGQVNIDGVEPADISVYLKIDKIKEYDVDVGTLFEELGSSNFNLTVGHVTKDGLRYDLRAMSNLTTVEQLEAIPIDDRGLRLRDIADVVYATPALTYGRYLNMEPAVAFWIQKSSGYNTVSVVSDIRAELEEINRDPALEGIDVLMFFDQGEQITNSIRGLLTAGLVGAVLAVGILYFFLLRIGTTLIVSLSIPISIIGTACFLYLTGRSLNVLSMMGLMLAVGMLIDNAVVVLESIYQHMDKDEDANTATLRGTGDVGRAVVSATLTSIIVFAPVIFGNQSELVVWLKEIGITIAVTLLFSLAVSLTVIPVLTAHLLKGGKQSVGRNPWVARWTSGYARVLRWTAVRHPWITGVPIAIAGLLVTGVAVGVSGFRPEVDSGRGIRREYVQFAYEFSDNPDYRRTKEYVNRVQEILWAKQEDYGLEYMYSWYADDVAFTRLYLGKDALSEGDMKSLRERLREDLPTLAGVKFQMGDDSGEGSGVDRFTVTLHGEDSELLNTYADEVKRRLSAVPDVFDVSTDVERGAEEIHVMVDGQRADRLGVTPRDVARLMGITFRGVQLSRVRAEEKEVELWVVLQPEDRSNIENLKGLLVNVHEGREVTLDQVASTVMGRGASRIQRINQKTAVRVRGNYEGERFDDVLDTIDETMATVHLPPGYGWNFGSEIRERQEQQNDMAVNALLAIICVYMVMACLFESLIHPAVVMFCMPFASLGVIWLMILTGTPFNIMAMIGMVILIGVVVNNGIVLVDHINHHRREGMALEEAILAGGVERFRPILMTATTTILGLIPLALGRGHVGDAETYPMARALIGGLLSSTVLTLIMLPTYYHLSERIRVRLGRMFPGLARRLGRLPRLRRRRHSVPGTPEAV